MLLPARFGKYILLKELEVGGMAAVYLAKARGIAGFEKFLAIKKIYPQLSRSEEFVQMFVAEARIAVELAHPNISHIFDLGEVNGDYFIAMEYIHGKDAYRLIKRCQAQGRHIPLPLACHITLQVLEGLEYAHRKKDLSGQPMNIVHRDISPRNVLISYDGTVKLIDFGIAKASTLGGHTRVGTIKGKVNYMSPEQARGDEIDARSDLFSVGLLLYELLHLSRLFSGGSEIKTLELIRECNIPAIRANNPELPEELERILLKAFTRDRQDRYQSAQEFARDLQQFLARNEAVVSSSWLGGFMQECFAPEVSIEQKELDVFQKLSLEQTEPGALESGTIRTGSHLVLPTGRPADADLGVRADNQVQFPEDFLEETKLQDEEDLEVDEERLEGGETSGATSGTAAGMPSNSKAATTPMPVSPGGGRPHPGRQPVLAVLSAAVVVMAGIAALQLTSSPDPDQPTGRIRELPSPVTITGGLEPAGAPGQDRGTVAVATVATASSQLAAPGPASAEVGAIPAGPQTAPPGSAGASARPAEPGKRSGDGSSSGGAAAPVPADTGRPAPGRTEGAMTDRAGDRSGSSSAGGTPGSPAPGSSAAPKADPVPPAPVKTAPEPAETAPEPAAPAKNSTPVPAQAGGSSPPVQKAAVTVFGFLNVNATAPCLVRVDGVSTGLTTPVKQLRVPAGLRVVQLERLSDKTQQSFEIEVRPNQVHPVLWR